MACLRNLAIGVLSRAGPSTSLLPFTTTPATPPDPSPPSDELDNTTERRSPGETGATVINLLVNHGPPLPAARTKPPAARDSIHGHRPEIATNHATPPGSAVHRRRAALTRQGISRRAVVGPRHSGQQRPITVPSGQPIPRSMAVSAVMAPPVRIWHARGQGFKSPQLHSSQQGRSQSCLVFNIAAPSPERPRWCTVRSLAGAGGSPA